MSDLKTKPNNQSVETYLNSVEPQQKREDCTAILKLMQEVTGEAPQMWGDSIVGFGSYHYKYESGREGNMLQIGFSPRKQAMTLYIMPGFDRYEKLLSKLGKYKIGKSCLYIKKEEDIDMKVLKELVEKSFKYIKNKKWE